MISSLQEVCCASLPLEFLAALASVRDLTGTSVALHDGRAFVRWQPGEEAVLRAVLPIPGVQLYVQREERYYRYGRHVPSFHFPGRADFRPLHVVLTPQRLRPIPPSTAKHQAVALTLAPSPRPRPATALRCGLAELARWADTVPNGRLEMLRAAQSGGRVVVLGSPLPPLATAERFWGDTVLAPLGFRPEPDLPETALRAALGIGDDELLLVTAADLEAIPLAALGTLKRASIRLAIERAAP